MSGGFAARRDLNPGMLFTLYRLEPRLFPENQARCLATAVCFAIAAEFEMHCPIEPAAAVLD